MDNNLNLELMIRLVARLAAEAVIADMTNPPPSVGGANSGQVAAEDDDGRE